MATPSGRETRPSSDRVREGLFNALSARMDLAGVRFADLYAGSGAVGLEALSRGAAYSLLVEADQRAAQVARGNVTSLGVGSSAKVVLGRVERLVERLVAQPSAVEPAASPWSRPFDVVFADPPYSVADPEVLAVLTALVSNGWLARDSVIVVERSARDKPFSWVAGITPDGGRRYGETALWYGRHP